MVKIYSWGLIFLGLSIFSQAQSPVTIKSIDPVWGGKNIPPKPERVLISQGEVNPKTNAVTVTETPNPEYAEWLEYFGENLIGAWSEK